MLGDCIAFICLICAIACILVLSLNKHGYDFTVSDTLLLCFLGIACFLIPFGIIRFIAGFLVG